MDKNFSIYYVHNVNLNRFLLSRFEEELSALLELWTIVE